jgi:hypothetical protein
MVKKILKIGFLSFALLFLAQGVSAHEGRHHEGGAGPQSNGARGASEGNGLKDNRSHDAEGPATSPENIEKYKQINELYLSQVKPIFQKKCFDCHSQNTQYPWYYKFPGVKQLIDHDTREAKEHLDYTNDFPFSGHGTPAKDLDAIQDEVKEDSMPIFRYWILHRDSGLTQEEQRIILEWVKSSQAILGEESHQ